MAKNSKERRAAERAAAFAKRAEEAERLGISPAELGNLLKSGAAVTAPVVPEPVVVAPPPPPEPKKKEPKKRYVRPPKTGETKAPTSPALPERSKKLFGMLMTKNLAVPPMEDSFGRPIDAVK